MQHAYSTNTYGIHDEYNVSTTQKTIHLQNECNTKATRIQHEYNMNTKEIQHKHDINTNGIQYEYSMNTHMNTLCIHNENQYNTITKRIRH